VVGGSLLDEILRDGARAMLAAALQAELAAYIDAHVDELDAAGRRLLVRNGYHGERDVTTGAGALPVWAPRVNDRRVEENTGERVRFASSILRGVARKAPKVAEVNCQPQPLPSTTRRSLRPKVIYPARGTGPRRRPARRCRTHS